MQIAITGGSGRVGRAVIELALSQGHGVVSIDRAEPAQDGARAGVARIEADVTDYATFKRALRGCEALIHLAAIPSPDKHADHVVHNNNVVSSYNALRAAAQLGIKRVCLASSINAIGGIYSRRPRYDYFPLDEQHPTYNEDPYSLSKWVCEQQGASFARRYENMTIASLRLHGVTRHRPGGARHDDKRGQTLAKQLWGYTRREAAARACMLALTADFSGHEVFYIVAPETIMAVSSCELKEQFYPDVPVRGDLSGNRGFFNCEKAGRLLGWYHDERNDLENRSTRK